MKKRYALLSLLLALPAISSCGDSVESKVALDMGRLYDSSASSHFDAIELSDLASMVNNEESFILLVYDTRSSCECWAIFKNTIYSFMEERNAKVYALSIDDIDANNEYGISVVSDTETVAIFENGTLAYQKYRNGTEDSFATDEDVFLAYMDERLEYSSLLEANEDQLDDLYEGDDEFTIYYGRSGCSDCNYVESHFLFDYMEENETANLYYYDLEYLLDDQEAYQAFKDEIGLSEANNEELGYGNGVVPTFFHVFPGGGSTKIEKADDAAVYLNNTIELIDGVYTITDTYYTEERLSSLTSLSDSDVETKVLEGLTFEEDDVIVSGENLYLRNSSAAIYGDPILKAFLDAYIAL